jgi:hypothetical protein
MLRLSNKKKLKFRLICGFCDKSFRSLTRFTQFCQDCLQDDELFRYGGHIWEAV